MKNLKSLSLTTLGGFTLFELLITISIIGILTAIASISFSAAQKKGRDARRMQDIKGIQTAAEQYYSINNFYPSGTSFVNFANALVTANLMQAAPADPKGATYSFQYNVYQVSLTDYCVCSLLENLTAGNASATDPCVFAASSRYFCAKNQQ